MATGTVKWFSDDKGYGFIKPGDGGKDLFVHHIAGSGFKSLAEGAKVEYEEEQGPKGPNAANVRTICSERAPESGADGLPPRGRRGPNADARAVACKSGDEVARDAGVANDGASTPAIDLEPIR